MISCKLHQSDRLTFRSKEVQLCPIPKGEIKSVLNIKTTSQLRACIKYSVVVFPQFTFHSDLQISPLFTINQNTFTFNLGTQRWLPLPEQGCSSSRGTIQKSIFCETNASFVQVSSMWAWCLCWPKRKTTLTTKLPLALPLFTNSFKTGSFTNPTGYTIT